MSRILFIPFYSEVNIIRKRELDECLAKNIVNKLIDKIVLVCDETVSQNIFMDFDKVEVCHWGKRVTFADLFYRISPKYADADDLKLFANSDLYFDDSLAALDYIKWDK